MPLPKTKSWTTYIRTIISLEFGKEEIVFVVAAQIGAVVNDHAIQQIRP